MAGAQVEFNVSDAGLQALWETLDQAGEMDTALAAFGEYLLESHDFRFRLEISPDGEPWEPLNPAYARRKLKKKGTDRILVFDGFLKDTLAYEVSGGELRFGSNRIYAATHQFGAPERGIPAREFIGLSEDDLDELEDILQEQVDLLLGGP